MADDLSPLEQVSASASQGNPPPMSPATTGLGGLSPDITTQFMQQMAEDRVRGDKALTQRQGALETYQEAIRQAPKSRTGVDAFNAIGEGFYANPNFAWNPSTALAAGFARMNTINDERRKEAQEAPVKAAQVGYENYKDLSDKFAAKDTMTPAAMVNFLNQDKRTVFSGLRQNSQQYQALFKINLEANIKANNPNAIATATQQTDEMFDRAQTRPDAQPLRTGIGLPPAPGTVPPPLGTPPPAPAPSSSVPPPPSGPLAQIPATLKGTTSGRPVRDVIAEDIAANPGVPARVNIVPTPGAAPVQGVVPPPPAPGAPTPAMGAVPARGTPGLSIEERAAQAGAIKRAEAGATEVGKELPAEGLKYYTELSGEAHTANDTKRVLNAVDNNLKRLEEQQKVGKFADLNKFAATVKYALDPTTKLGIATKQDIENAASFEAADKENFQLGVSSAKNLSSRATQMEFLRALQNNPNAGMTGPARERIMHMLKDTVDDVTHQHADLLKYMHDNNLDPTRIAEATPAQLANLTGHKNTYAQYQTARLEGRDIVDKAGDKGLTVPFAGTDGKVAQITVHPYWSNKYRALVFKAPDGMIRKLNVQRSEE